VKTAVDLQDAANLAVVVGLIASVAFNFYQYFFGPWAERREVMRELRTKLEGEIHSAKVAAKSPTMGAYMGRLETWVQDSDAFPKRIRREVAPFYQLTKEYWDAYLLAVKIVKLCIYEAVAARTDLARVPPESSKGGPPWIVIGSSSSRMSRNNLEDSFIEVLVEPLLRGEHLRWSWLKDHQEEFSKQLLLVTDESTVNRLLDDIEKKVEFEKALVERPRRIKTAIAGYRLRYLRVAES